MARKKYSAASDVHTSPSHGTRPAATARIATSQKNRPSCTFVEWFEARIFEHDMSLGVTRWGWEATQNPFYAWSAIDICARKQIQFPDWINQYLTECARRMLSPDAAASRDLRKILPRIMGFPQKRGRGHPLEPDREWQYLEPALRFAAEIARGAKPNAALHSAFEVLDQEAADKMDDKTLLGHIKNIFEMTVAPRTNAEWKRAIRAWGVRAFGPFAKEYREILP